MTLKSRLLVTFEIKRYGLSTLVISGMFFALLLFKVWPRFQSDVLAIPWFFDLLGLGVCTVMSVKSLKK